MAEPTRAVLRAGLTGLFGLLLACVTATASARTPETLADPAIEARTMALAHELRCLVCQNETVAESTADLAVDLRTQIRQQLTQGRSEAEVMAWMTERYGDFVLYRPPLGWRTALLWWGPFALLLIGGALLWRRLRRDAHAPADDSGAGLAMDPARRARALALLEGRVEGHNP
jgi:cytochrome c-type biogenesis protein CcmH